MKIEFVFSLLVTALAGAEAVAISNATCEAFANGSISTGSSTVNATLHWQHECASASTTFTLVGEAPNNGTGTSGWLGVGFIGADELNSSAYMSNADLYLFASVDDVFMNGIAPRNTRPSPQNQSDVIGTPSFNLSGDVFSVVFSRPWAAIDASHADLTEAPLRLLAARGFFSNGTFGFHYKNALLVDEPLYFFQSPPPPTTPGSTSSDNPCLTQHSFSNHFQLMLDTMPVNVNYTIDCVATTATFTVSTETTGWLALGFNTQTSMGGVNAFQMTVSDNGTVDVREAYANGHDVEAVESPQTLLTGAKPTGTLVNGTMTVTFTRWLAPPNTTADNQYAISASNPLYILASRRTNSSDMDKPHMLRTALGRGHSGVPVQLFTLGTVVVNFGDDMDFFSNNRLLITGHGIAMLLAWAVLGNIGVFVSRFLKALGHRWYLLHRHIMLGLVFLTALGFALGFAHVQLNGDPHFQLLIDMYPIGRSNPHAVLGLAICVAMVVQVALGFVSNRLYDKMRRAVPWWPDRFHWWFGRLLLLASFINIYLGLWCMNEHIFSASVVAFVVFKIITGIMHTWGACSIAKHDSHEFADSVNGIISDDSDNRFGSDLRPLLGGGLSVVQRQAEAWLVRLRAFALVLTVLAFVIIVLAWHRYGGNLMHTDY
jgi:hypothetical protein